MPTATAWRRRHDSTPRRGTSPVRPTADSIERLSPEPQPVTPTKYVYAGRSRREQNTNDLYGLGLTHPSFQDRKALHPDHLYLDQNGGAHLGAKLRSPQHNTQHFEQTSQSSRSHNPRSSSTTYRGPPKNRGHTRSGSTIDDLANIAIATSPQFNTSNPTFSFDGSPPLYSTSRPNTSYINGYAQESFDRPAKRIKSERLPNTEWSLHDERPRSSYTYHTQVTREDAELLLSLRDAFKIPMPAPMSQHAAVTPFEVQPEVASAHITEPSPVIFAATPSVSEQDHQNTEIQTPQIEEIQQESSGLADTTASIQPILNPELHEKDYGDELDTEEKQEEIKMEYHDEGPRVTSPKPPPIQTATGTAEQEAEPISHDPPPKRIRKVVPETQAEYCTECKKLAYNESEEESTMLWIGCEGCKRWFHYPCAGFTDRQEAKSVDKFICKTCEPQHGKTTFVRKSSRPRTAIDYAGLNEGVVKSSEETTMHHYVPKFKDGSIQFHHDDFARLRPELLTQEFWENMDGMKRPFVVPACWNPRWGQPQSGESESETKTDTTLESEADIQMYTINGEKVDPSAIATSLQGTRQQEEVIDLDQDYLDMVMPRNLTVRQVAELYGPEEPVPVIDVKSQETKGKFTLRQWANYYEEPTNKPVRNVISLEVSHSRLGRIIRRPKVVRDIDLEDQVWELESRNACNKRPVAFYCLMHQNVLFIPPEDRYLKKYEEWCLSDTQNETWLGDLCNGNVTRVDLHEGDTAFIPAGWIHSVWTPEDSLVIGGNFLTRYDFDYQLKVVQIEKVTKVAQSFKYPFFQKVMWYTLLKYLEEDPVPESIIQEFQDDPEFRYLRANPVWKEYEDWTVDNEPEEGDYNARKYSKSELRGLPMLRDYLYRTARINSDLPVENITKKQIDAVKGSIPKGYGDPMQLICLFAVWCAWKLGNITVPDWVHEDSMLQQGLEKQNKEKPRRAEALRIPPERQSARRRPQASATPEPAATPEPDETGVLKSSAKMITPRIACESCRKKRIKCRHREDSRLDETAQQTLEKSRIYPNVNVDVAKLARASPIVNSVEGPGPGPGPASAAATTPNPTSTNTQENQSETSNSTDLAQAALARMNSQPPETSGPLVNGTAPGSAKKGRSKACEECRKSKRRCVHDEYGRIDPAKVAEPSKPRGSTSSKRPPRLSDENSSSKRPRGEYDGDNDYAISMSGLDADINIDPALLGPIEHMDGVAYYDPTALISDVGAISTPPHPLTTQSSIDHGGETSFGSIDQNIDPALQIPAEEPTTMQDAHMSDTEDLRQVLPADFTLLKNFATSTPDIDKSYSPITASADDQSTEAAQTRPETTNADSDRDQSVHAFEVNGVVHTKPEPLIDSVEHVDDKDRRHSSTATGVSPKQEELGSPGLLSRRSSSHTSGTTHQALVGTDETITAQAPSANNLDLPTTNARPTSLIKSEDMTSLSDTRHLERASTAASSISDADADERLARELQAAEHGLRLRHSVRAS